MDKKMEKESFKNKAFTLAEVLIVIVVVGVVAALTIPVLINIISEKAQKSQTDVIEARFLDGLNRYNAMDDGLSKHYENTYEFLEGLSKYYKMSQICRADEITKCVPYAKIFYETGTGENIVHKSAKVSDLTVTSKLMSGVAAKDYLPPASFISAQGTPFIVAFKKDCIWDNGQTMSTIQDSGCVEIMYDKNGVNLPNKFGDDVVGLGLTLGAPYKTVNGVKIMEKPFYLSTGIASQSLCLAETTPEKQAEYLAVGNQTAITQCVYGNNQDYWAAGMKYCKDKGYHLPTDNEWSKIYQGLFNFDGYDGWGFGGSERLNANLASDLGLSFPSGVDRKYCVWSSNETANNAATVLGVSLSASGWVSRTCSGDPFKSRNHMIICIEK